MIAVRLRTRDGLERIHVEQNASLSALKDLISQKVERPHEQLTISTDQTLVRIFPCRSAVNLFGASDLVLLLHSDVSTTPCLQLTSKSPETFLDLTDDDSSLSELGFKNGQMVRCISMMPCAPL